MGTTYFSCGCSITRSMFAGNEIISAHPCMKHAVVMQEQLQVVVNEMQRLVALEPLTKD